MTHRTRSRWSTTELHPSPFILYQKRCVIAFKTFSGFKLVYFKSFTEAGGYSVSKPKL